MRGATLLGRDRTPRTRPPPATPRAPEPADHGGRRPRRTCRAGEPAGRHAAVQRCYGHDEPCADAWGRPVPDRQHDLVKLALAHAPAFEPGANWSYSKAGYLPAGMIVERGTGHPYGDEIRRRVIEPRSRARRPSSATIRRSAGEVMSTRPTGDPDCRTTGAGTRSLPPCRRCRRTGTCSCCRRSGKRCRLPQDFRRPTGASRGLPVSGTKTHQYPEIPGTCQTCVLGFVCLRHRVNVAQAGSRRENPVQAGGTA
ncbi:serine hydrolase [Streptomyces xanthochromogenes]|uniref:serine hydrolase n=1 Tax=Streptomyces xanthochromogenes TaxID=67384 RepID=UPI002279915D|nr:serine hydrolase domain-containing protein [Streptomyces xanthochromogenes]